MEDYKHDYCFSIGSFLINYYFNDVKMDSEHACITKSNINIKLGLYHKDI